MSTALQGGDSILSWISKKWNIFKNFLIIRRNRKLNKKNKGKNKSNNESVMAASMIVPNNNVSVINVDNGTSVLDVDLIDKEIDKEEKKNVKTFTKKWVDVILTVALIDIQLVFVLAFMNKNQIAETLGVAIVTEIVGVSIAYFIKAFFESFSIAKNELEQERIKREYYVKPYYPSDDNNSDNFDDNAVG